MKELPYLLLVSLLTFFLPGGSPCDMITLKDYENFARERLPLSSRDYLERGADQDRTLNRNTEAFTRIQLLPRSLRDVSNRTTKAMALGKTFNLPVGISPTGLQKRWHPDGEIATAKAAQAAGTIVIVSTVSSVLFEDIAKEAPEAEKWLQIFLFNNKTITYDLIRRAEGLGFGAIVVTVDMPVKALRYFNQKNNLQDTHKMVNLEPLDQIDPSSLGRDSATWSYLQEVVNSTNLPVIVKGILTPGDARLAFTSGARGIIVSNHGGRQLDGTVSTIEALHAIKTDFPESTYKGFDIYMDGGIRSGLDVFRALAVGAKYVFVGRPAVWGLFHSGQQGVEAVIEIFRKELEIIMGLSGCSTVDQIDKYLVSFNFPF